MTDGVGDQDRRGDAVGDADTARAAEEDAPASVLEAFGYGCLVGGLLYFLSYFTATIVYAVLLRRGIPLGPFIALPIGVVVMGLVGVAERRLLRWERWPEVEALWSQVSFVLAAPLPIALAVVWPKPVATELPGIAAVAFSIALIVGPIVVLFVAIRWRARRPPEAQQD